MELQQILYLFIGIHSLLSVLVSIYIARLDDLETFQKIVQVLLVWLVPLFAAIGLWLFNRSQQNNFSLNKEFGGGTRTSIDPGGHD